MGMCVREATAWYGLASTVAVYGVYFASLGPKALRGELTPGMAAGGLVLAVVAQSALGIVAGIAIAVRLGADRPDERDHAIAQASLRTAYFLMLSALVCLALPLSVWGGLPWSPLALGQLLLLVVVLAETTRFGSQVFRYRRGH